MKGTKKKPRASGQMLSILTGEPIDSPFYEPELAWKRRAIGWCIPVLTLGVMWLLPPALPGPPISLTEINPPSLVFLVQPGPGGGGGGSDEHSPEPPSVQKIEGQDQGRVAIDVDDSERLVFKEEKEPEPEEPEEEEDLVEEDTTQVEAPVVAQAPDDISQQGILEGAERLIESLGDNGSGTGIGSGEGSGIGEGYGGGFGGGAYRIGSGVEAPAVRRMVKPAYTDNAMARKIEGSVVLEVVILANGSVGPIRVIRSLDPGLDRRAIEAVRQWVFFPGKLQGSPVDVLAEIVVDFTLL